MLAYQLDRDFRVPVSKALDIINPVNLSRFAYLFRMVSEAVCALFLYTWIVDFDPFVKDWDELRDRFT